MSDHTATRPAPTHSPPDNAMNRRALALLAALSTTVACASEPTVDPEVARILDAVVASTDRTEADASIYRLAEVGPDDALHPLLGEGDAPGAAIDIAGPATLYLVDLAPEAMWAHDAAIVLVPDDGGALQVVDSQWWPVLDGVELEPWAQEPVWGVDPVVDAPDVDGAVPVMGPAIGPPPPDADPCDPERPDVALTIAGDDDPRILRSEAEMHVALSNRGYAVTRVRATADAGATKRAVTQQLQALAGRAGLGEVVVSYIGHGAGGAGSWVFGDSESGTASLSIYDTAKLLRDIDAERITFVVDACHSGHWVEDLGDALQLYEKTEDVEVRVLSSAAKGESAVLGSPTALYTWKLFTGLPAGTAEDKVDWGAVAIAPISARLRGGVTNTQTPKNGFTEPRLPILTDRTDDVSGACVVGSIDSQAYDRRIMVSGQWFGDDAGKVELQSEDGTWKPIDVVYWSDTGISARLPMRKDGYPSDGHSPDAEDAAGRYALRVVRSDGKQSRDEDLDQVHVELQVYSNDFAPYDGVLWNEMWHPWSPAASWTQGGTVQLSRVSLRDAELETDLDRLRLSDTPAMHETSPGIQALAGWGYDLFPMPRDLTTAYDQRQPDTSYFGFQTVFGEDFSDTRAWRYELAYD